MRVSQLSLSYEMFSKASHRASVWIGDQNLLVTGKYWGFDPNVSSAGAAPLYAGRDASVYPVARMWQVGYEENSSAAAWLFPYLILLGVQRTL